MNDYDWKKLKNRIDNFPDNIDAMIKNYEKEFPNRVISFYSGKYLKTEIKIDQNIILYVYKNNNGGIEKAFYTAFDILNSRSYVRNI